jgi:RNA polymerase sigma factor
LGFLFWKKEKPSSLDLENLVAAAAGGDAAARDGLIRSYTPFVLRVASRACGRYVEPGRDDEVSIGLTAFNEAIDRYRPSSGASFLTFAEMVIRRRLIDHFRREGTRRETPLSDFEQEGEEGEVTNPAEVEGAIREHRASVEAEDRRAEVARFAEVLAEYGIGLDELVRVSPQHRDARERAAQVARAVAGNPEWAAYLRGRHALPLRALEETGDLAVSRKTLERQRKYIIALALVLLEGLEYLQSYLPEG